MDDDQKKSLRVLRSGKLFSSDRGPKNLTNLSDKSTKSNLKRRRSNLIQSTISPGRKVARSRGRPPRLDPLRRSLPLQLELSTSKSRTSIRTSSDAEPTARNIGSRPACAVCKDALLDSMIPEEGTAGFLTFSENPAFNCIKCHRPFHLMCVYGDIQLQNWAVDNPDCFICQDCIRCYRCDEPIFDPGNVQCVYCGIAYHESCKPTVRMPHDYPSLIQTWYCPTCELNLLRLMEDSAGESDDEKNPAKSPIKKNRKEHVSTSKKLNESAAKSRLSDNKLDRRLRKSKDAGRSPTRIRKEEKIEETRKRRLALLNRLKDCIRYRGEIMCLSAQESTFTRLNEEFGEEAVEEKDHRLSCYAPFAVVGKCEIASSSNSQNNVQFFYGSIPYQPQFYNFLSSMFVDYRQISFCQRCLIACTSQESMAEHATYCEMKYPPGDQIYQENNVSIWEISGSTHKAYSRRLTIFAKTFIGSKTVHHEVEQFKFYVLTERESDHYVVAGYFSKEVKPTGNNNLSCLLILPWMQRKGYGLFLIDLSYQLSLRERKIGSPEHPLSNAGLKTYRQYWFARIMGFLREKVYHAEKVDLNEIRESTGIDIKDILETLIIADMTFIVDDKLQINETALFTPISSLRRRFIRPKLLKYMSSENLLVSNNFISLPNETVESIFSYLPASQIWTNGRSVCSRFNRILSSDSFWSRYLRGIYEPVSNASEHSPWMRAVSIDKEANRWKTNQCLYKSRCSNVHYGTVDALKIHETRGHKRFAVSGARDRSLILWDIKAVVENTDPIAWSNIVNNAHSGWIWSVCVGDDDEHIYSGSFDSRLKQWHLKNNRIELLRDEDVGAAILHCHTECNMLYSSTVSGLINVSDVRKGLAPQQTYDAGYRCPYNSVKSVPLSNYLYALSIENEHILVVDKRQMKVVKKVTSSKSCMSLNFHGQHLITSSKMGIVQYINPNTMQVEYEWRSPDSCELGNKSLNPIHVSTGAFIYASSYQLCIYSPGRNPKLLSKFDTKDMIVSVDYNNGDLICGTSDGAVVFWPRENPSFPVNFE